MCKAFSCLVTKDKVYWKAGMDSHDAIEKEFNLNPPHTKEYEADDTKLFARVEITPDNNKKYPYLYPDDAWELRIDETIAPDWYTKKHSDMAWEAFNEWKQIIYKFNYQEALNPINPLKVRRHKPSKNDILLLKEWASVWDSGWASVGASVRASVWDSVWASVRDSIWDSVRASVGASVWASVRASVGDSVRGYISSLFPEIKNWKYLKEGQNFNSCAALWRKGLVPSFDGKIWRLHSGKDMAIVFEISKEKLKEVK